MNGLIKAEQIGKAYKTYNSRWKRLFEFIIPFNSKKHELKWVLKNLNFEIDSGDAVGIIGVNGAGKSTLLKLITGTSVPTSGSLVVKGSVSALLELGLGFHPEFTGRQNVLMASQLLGLNKSEIENLIPEIEEFAEIGGYIDQPIRVYSSGMQVRLAFSVATAVRPDILIVDEALAVGDVYFQQKCYERIQDFVAQGTTLFFVSHGMGTILQLCSKALYLKEGSIVYFGEPKTAVDLYQADMLAKLEAVHQYASERNLNINLGNEVTLGPAPEFTEITGRAGSITTDDAYCSDIKVFNSLGVETDSVTDSEEMSIQITYRIRRNLSDPHIGFKIRNRTGTVLYESNSFCLKHKLGYGKAGTDLVARFTFQASLMADEYSLTIGLSNIGYGDGLFKETISYLHDVKSFIVYRPLNSDIWAGIVNLRPRLTSFFTNENLL